MNRSLRLVPLLVLIIIVAARADAPPAVEVVLENLDRPQGVAIQPETGYVYVADSGRGRIVRLVDGKLEDVASGFVVDQDRAADVLGNGPLGLTFLALDNRSLVIGAGGEGLGRDTLYVLQ